MKQIEFALIAALYDSKSADFYRDIYFPIIKYCVADLYYNMSNKNGIYEISELQEKIDNEFGITVPRAILVQCVRALEYKQDGVRLKYYKENDMFQVKEAWETSTNTDILNRAQEIRDEFSKLEVLFQQYLVEESLECNKNFITFFTDYTEETLNFIENGFTDLEVNQEYANLARFISWIEKEHSDLYMVISDILWASIIAAFLQRKNFDLNLKPVSNVKYYLDTSLVLAMLGLDSDENVSYAKELIDIIKQAGGVPEVHPITIREVSRILESVIHDGGPRSNSAIEQGYIRLKFTPSLLLNLKNNLSKTISNDYKIEVGFKSDAELAQIESRYRNNPLVKELAEKWMSTSAEPFREIHDIYMSEFVFRENKNASTIEKRVSFFVTKNKDLISFAREKQNASLLHPGKVIMSLWTHNAASHLIKKAGLVEAVSRCFAMNQTDARQKIKAIARYVNFDGFSRQDMNFMYKSLIHRSNKTIQNIEALVKEENDDDNQKQARAAEIVNASIEEEKERENSRISDKRVIEQLSQELNGLSKQVADATTNSETTQQKLNEVMKTLQDTNIEKQNQEKVIEGLRKKIQDKDKALELNNNIGKLKEELSAMNKERERSVSFAKYRIVLTVESVFVCVLLSCLVILIIQTIKKQSMPNLNNISTWGFIVSLLGLILRAKELYILSPKVKYLDQRKEQLAYWDETHPEYKEMKQKIIDLQDTLKQYEEI